MPPFDIFAFYRGRHTNFGIVTPALSSVQTGEALQSLLPGFGVGALRPFPIMAGSRYTLVEARDAFVAVLGTSRDGSCWC